MPPLGAIVEWGDLLEVVWSSMLAGIGVTAGFGLAILGGTRTLEVGRQGRFPEVILYGVLAVASFVFVTAAVVLGIVVMTSK